jgi:hypothetical protein
MIGSFANHSGFAQCGMLPQGSKKMKMDENGKYITSDDIAYFVSGCREVAPGFLEMQPKHPANYSRCFLESTFSSC